MPLFKPDGEMVDHDSSPTATEEELQISKAFEARLAAQLAANENIPETAFCNHPEAVTKIPLKEGPPIFKPQYPIPVHYQAQLDEQIQIWLRTGRIKVAKPEVQWNLPLTVSRVTNNQNEVTSVRVCLDTRALKDRMLVNPFPIPGMRTCCNLWCRIASSRCWIFRRLSRNSHWIQRIRTSSRSRSNRISRCGDSNT